MFDSSLLLIVPIYLLVILRQKCTKSENEKIITNFFPKKFFTGKIRRPTVRPILLGTHFIAYCSHTCNRTDSVFD